MPFTESKHVAFADGAWQTHRQDYGGPDLTYPVHVPDPVTHPELNSKTSGQAKEPKWELNMLHRAQGCLEGHHIKYPILFIVKHLQLWQWGKSISESAVVKWRSAVYSEAAWWYGYQRSQCSHALWGPHIISAIELYFHTVKWYSGPCSLACLKAVACISQQTPKALNKYDPF